MKRIQCNKFTSKISKVSSTHSMQNNINLRQIFCLSFYKFLYDFIRYLKCDNWAIQTVTKAITYQQHLVASKRIQTDMRIYFTWIFVIKCYIL